MTMPDFVRSIVTRPASLFFTFGVFPLGAQAGALKKRLARGLVDNLHVNDNLNATTRGRGAGGICAEPDRHVRLVFRDRAGDDRVGARLGCFTQAEAIPKRLAQRQVKLTRDLRVRGFILEWEDGDGADVARQTTAA
jgi:hypothetical protein